MNILAQMEAAFNERYGRSPTVIVKAPGTVSLLGQAGTAQVTAAIDRGVWVAAAPTDTSLVTIFALNFQEDGRFQLPFLNVHASSVAGNWINYPVGVAWALQNAGHELVGMDVLLFGDLPPGVGLGSSAAVTLAFVQAWEAVAGFNLTAEERAQIGLQTEKAYLGKAADAVPFLTAVHAQKDHLLSIDTQQAVEAVPCPLNLALLVINSGSRLSPVSSDQDVAAAAAVILQPHLPHIHTLNDLTLDDFEMHSHHLPEPLRQQTQHLIEEAARAQSAKAALQQDALSTFARLLRHSHISLRDLWGGSTPELDTLAAAAWPIPGCYGARLIGNGGLLAILAEETAVSAIQQAIHEAFEGEYGRVPQMFVTTFSNGVNIYSDT